MTGWTRRGKEREEEIARDAEWLRARYAPLKAGIHRPLILTGDVLRTKIPGAGSRPRRPAWTRPLAAAMGAVVIVAGVLLAAGRLRPALETAENAAAPAMLDAAPAQEPVSAAQSSSAAAQDAAIPEAAALPAEGAPVAGAEEKTASQPDENPDAGAEQKADSAPKRAGTAPLVVSAAQSYAQIAGRIENADPARAAQEETAPRALAASASPQANLAAADADDPAPLKTQEDRLYYIGRAGESRAKTELYTVSLADMELLSRVELTGGHTGDLLVEGDRLCVITSEDDALSDPLAAGARGAVPSVSVRLYDVDDPANPSLTRTFTQSGELVDAEIVDGVLYLVTEYAAPGELWRDEYGLDPAQAVPRTNDGGAEAVVAAEDVLLPAGAGADAYAVVTALNVREAQAASTRAVLGAQASLLTEKAVYCAFEARADGDARTGLVELTLEGERVDLGASVSVEGALAQGEPVQSAEGGLWVATQIKGATRFQLLGAGLAALGAADVPVAAGEVRFTDGAAYVSPYTGEAVQAIDLSGPAAPRLAGALSGALPASLAPLGGGLAVALGEAGGGGLRVELLRTGNPARLAAADSVTIAAPEGTSVYSPALADPRAMVFGAGGVFGFPVSGGAEGKDGAWNAYSRFELFRVREGRIETIGSVSHATGKSFDYGRHEILDAAVCGGTLVTATDGEIRATDLATLRLTGSVRLL